MRILLIGPHPPPHGGISVHVSGIHRQLTAAGVTCRVLDMSLVRPGFGFGWTVLRHALWGWTLHLHTTGARRGHDIHRAVRAALPHSPAAGGGKWRVFGCAGNSSGCGWKAAC
jgi:hypothetical protein